MEKKERRLEKKLRHKFGGERAPGKGPERLKPRAALTLAQRGWRRFYRAKVRRSRSEAKESRGTHHPSESLGLRP